MQYSQNCYFTAADREYIMSLRMTYFRPCLTGLPSCRMSWSNRTTRPAEGQILHCSVPSSSKKVVWPPCSSSPFRYTCTVKERSSVWCRDCYKHTLHMHYDGYAQTGLVPMAHTMLDNMSVAKERWQNKLTCIVRKLNSLPSGRSKQPS